MQSECSDGLFGAVKEFDAKELEGLIDDGAEKVSVFKANRSGTQSSKKELFGYDT